eukprot:389400-Pleurochrysis_carterae.AAC.1
MKRVWRFTTQSSAPWASSSPRPGKFLAGDEQSTSCASPWSVSLALSAKRQSLPTLAWPLLHELLNSDRRA